ncbi:MAG: prepilin-type N-terminal cleavage/methylation domain-containing protein [Pseudomonadota bacterium]
MSGRGRLEGYTLIELIAVIVILGILAVFAAPRFVTTSAFEQRGYEEEILSFVRYAHKLAIASGCTTNVLFDGVNDVVRVRRYIGGSNCRDNSNPAFLEPIARAGASANPSDIDDPENLFANAPSGISIGNLEFDFDHVGRPLAVGTSTLITLPAALQVTIGSSSLQVAPNTGYAALN